MALPLGELAACYDGLYRNVADSEGEHFILAGAESVDVSEDGTVYTYHLRQNAAWSDGVPVTAKDYVYGWTRLLKTSMLDVVNQEYVLTAESKGLSQGQIIRLHILRNAFIPLMTQLPMSVAMCITGSFFIESIYAIPGIGQYYVTAVNNQDLSIVLGETVLISILYILVLFVTDILYVVVDPRIQLPGKKRR